MLSGRALTKDFGKTRALNGVNVEVRRGTITVLIGPSGGGKTTLLRCLALLDPPDVGEITVEETKYAFPKAKQPHPPPPWPQVTIVFQQLFLWPHLTLRENILLPLSAAKRPIDQARELTELFGMSSFLDRYPNQVSIGQRQRAALVRALAVEPRYILLDEITSALDIEQTGIILRHLLDLRDKGLGILLITHHLGFARQLLQRRQGDQVLFLDSGRVLEGGGIEALENPTSPRLRQFLEASTPVF